MKSYVEYMKGDISLSIIDKMKKRIKDKKKQEDRDSPKKKVTETEDELVERGIRIVCFFRSRFLLSFSSSYVFTL
jgi:hypothetical protein